MTGRKFCKANICHRQYRVLDLILTCHTWPRPRPRPPRPRPKHWPLGLEPCDAGWRRTT